ncbi:MAG TPA: DUF2291 domain-containing protein [Candidatus Brachybacterium merdavium]|uniref:DUF2291 domain-containing protein n=1 Tax=Candidatus Brachybacterium merdavium TaxID=2838513 RepID=A0A9D2RNY2_9MICO|nr:DUF2291 domain-containing protein [Candidatus Brachybacterium merdavium]
MSTASDDSAGAGPRAPVVPQRRHTGRLVAVIITVLAVILVVVGTKVVPDEEIAAETADFDKETFGAENFPDIQAGIVKRAVDAPELAEALESDPEGTAEEHGNEVDGKTVYSTSFTGTVEENESGILDLDVDDMPEGITVRVQTGPAINGTELRDATGDLDFGQFTNQIEFQDAGAALNEEMKEQVIEPVDVDGLEGETVTITGAFTAVNPEAWLVTPATLEVE